MPLSIPSSVDLVQVQQLIDAAGDQRKTYSTQIINFKTTGQYTLFSVSSGQLFLVDQIDIISTACDTPGDAPYINFGTNLNPSQFTGILTNSNSPNARDSIYYPLDAIGSGESFMVSIATGSTAATHSGVIACVGAIISI